MDRAFLRRRPSSSFSARCRNAVVHGLGRADSYVHETKETMEEIFGHEGRLHQRGSAFNLERHLQVGLSRPPHSPAWREALAVPICISEDMQAVLGDDGLLILHRSKWRCLARSYWVEIERLITLMKHAYSKLDEPAKKMSMCRKLVGPLRALKQAVREGEACMHDYIPGRWYQRHKWIVHKALNQATSTDVVDVHLHHFLWVLSTVREQILRSIEDFAELEALQKDVALQTQKLCEIWKKANARDDLRIAADLFMKLKDKRGFKGTETCQLLDFLHQKLSHFGDASSHSSVSLPPYMWIDSDQCQVQKAIFSDECIKIDQVAWLGGSFALKIFKQMNCEFDFNSTEAAIQALFNREAAIQAMVCHSHVLPLVCCTTGCSGPGLLMEHMQQDLNAFMSGRRKPFSLFMAVDLMLQVAKGMEYLHSDALRIIHRDLKSRNILVSFPGNSVGGSQVHLKIADFGVSKASSVQTSTRDQGTRLWMAPEVYGGDDSNIVPTYSNMADVYSFGMVCFEILTGKLPFEGPNVKERVLAGERPKLPSHCPPALSTVIKMCWNKEPRERPSFTQISRMLLYIKSCIFLQADADQDLWLSHISPDIDITVNDMINHVGFMLDPMPLSIPTEMLLCGVAVHKPEFLDKFRSLYEIHI